jgi:hypothetical protein
MAALGSSFGVTPAGLEEQATRLKKRTPTQQALQTLSLKLPKVLGSDSAPPSDLMGGAYRPTVPGGGDASQARMSALVRAMTGKRAGSARPAAPPRFTGGAVQTPAPPPAAAQSTSPASPVAAIKAAVKPAVAAAKPSRVAGSGGSRSKITNAIKAKVPINPNVIGGGALEPPAAAAPPPQYMAGYRGSLWDGDSQTYYDSQQRAAQGGATADASGRYIPAGQAPYQRPY